MPRYPLRRSMHNLPPSWTQAAAGGPTVQRRRCLRRACSARPAFLAVAASHGPPSDPLAEDADEAELEPATDPFLDLPWWTLSRLISGAKRETPSPTPARMSSEEADDNHDLATILRRALMDLAAALQEIEQQLMSIPEDGAAPTRG